MGAAVSNIYEVAKRAGVSTATVSRVLSQPRRRHARHAPQGDAGGRVPRLRAELGGQEPAHAAHRQAARHGAGHLQSVFLADSPGHRRRRAARGLRGALRRHAARRGARGPLRADAEAEGSRRPDLPRPSPAEGSGGAGPRRWRRAARRSSTAASSAATRHPERAHRQRQGRGRGDGLPLPARPSPHRHHHRAAGQPAQPRSPARRDRAREAAEAPSATSSS